MKLTTKIGAVLALCLLVACVRAPAVTPVPRTKATARPTFTAAPSRPASTLAAAPTASPAQTSQPALLATAVMASATLEPTAVPSATPTPTLVPTATQEPTHTPFPEERRLSVDELPIAQPGNYVSLAFGYWMRYPVGWHTRFGIRPLLVSFSNLDPSTHNRESMRDQGCLIEINASVNVPGFSLDQLRAQLPRAMGGAEAIELDGEPALRLQRVGSEGSYDSDWVYVEHDDRWFLISAEYAKDASSVCLEAWEYVLDSWMWFEPEFAVYRNASYGYAVSYPRQWHLFNPREQGVWISSQDPSGVRDLLETPLVGMLVETDVLENPDDLLLSEWIAGQNWDVDAMRDVPIDGLLGVQVLRTGPSPDTQEMSAYFLGQLGRIHVVRCLYPTSRQWEFRPIANGIIYSFSF